MPAATFLSVPISVSIKLPPVKALQFRPRRSLIPLMGDCPCCQCDAHLVRMLEALEHERQFLIRFLPFGMKPQRFAAASAEFSGEHLILKNSQGKLVAMVLSDIVESWSEVAN